MKYYTEINTVMPLGASFPSKSVLLVFVFGLQGIDLCTESSSLLSLPTVIVSCSSRSLLLLICCFIFASN